jgi:hypothetical protein
MAKAKKGEISKVNRSVLNVTIANLEAVNGLGKNKGIVHNTKSPITEGYFDL